MLAQILLFLELALKILFSFRGLSLKFGKLLPQLVELVIQVRDHLAHDRHSFAVVLGSSHRTFGLGGGRYVGRDL